MFCEKCGNNISDNALFCSACGAPVPKAETAGADVKSEEAVNGAQAAQAAAAAPVQTASAPVQPAAVQTPPVQTPPMQTPPVQAPGQMPPVQAPYMQVPAAPSQASLVFSAVGEYIKGFFSGRVTQTVASAAKSRGLQWLVLALANIIIFMISATLNVKYALWSNTIVDVVASRLISIWAVLFANLFIGAAVYFALGGLIFGAMRLVFKKPVPYSAVMNMVGYATLPLTFAFTANIILGLIYVPLSLIVYTVAVIMSFCMLYIGIQKLDTLQKTPYFIFMAIAAITVVLAFLLTFVLYGAIIRSGVAYGAGSLIDGLSDLGGATDYFL